MWAEDEAFQSTAGDPWFARLSKRLARIVLYAVQIAAGLVGAVLIGALVVGIVSTSSPRTINWGAVERATENADAQREWEIESSRDWYPSVDMNEIRANQDAVQVQQDGERMFERAVRDAYAEGSRAARGSAGGLDPSLVDCEYFDTREEAEAFYEGAGGPESDPFWLDDDKDGRPCELLPSWDEVYE